MQLKTSHYKKITIKANDVSLKKPTTKYWKGNKYTVSGPCESQDINAILKLWLLQDSNVFLIVLCWNGSTNYYASTRLFYALGFLVQAA